MTAGFARLAGELLLQVAQTLPDTIITKQVAVEQGAFAKVATVAQGLMSIAILALTVVLIPAAWNFRTSYKKVNDLIDRFYGDIGPLVRNANLRFVELPASRYRARRMGTVQVSVNRQRYIPPQQA